MTSGSAVKGEGSAPEAFLSKLEDITGLGQNWTCDHTLPES